MDFAKTQIEVKSILKGANFSETEITLLQTVCNSDPIVDKIGNVLLFLEKYIGPITDNAYVCKGHYQGHYKLNGDSISSSLSENAKLTSEMKDIGTIDKLKGKIKEIKQKSEKN